MSSPAIASIELPAVDERLVVPDCGYEIDDGEIVRVSPCEEPHGSRHSKLAALLEAHAADEFMVAIDMLTRISKDSDRAPDASVYPRARDPRTGGRQLEHLAFEIVSTETRGNAGKKARGLSGRGVRRVFAIDVESACVLEWSRERGAWEELDADASISDPALATPLPIRALLRETEADYAVGRALVLKGNPAIEEAREESRVEGLAEGLAEGILAVLASRGIAVPVREEQQLLDQGDPARLRRWLARVATCESAAELLAIP